MFLDDQEFEVTVNEPELEVHQGDEARLLCSARGNKDKVQRINWSREGQELPPGKEFPLDKYIQPGLKFFSFPHIYSVFKEE